MRNLRRLPAIETRILAVAWLCCLAVAAFWCPASRAADPPARAVLHLANGGFAAGEIRASSQAGVLRWQAAPFVAPFEFGVSEVNAIQWPPPAVLPRPTGDFCFELADGDVVFGALVSLDDRHGELDVPRLGRLRIQRSELHRIYRWRDGADLIYLGPNGLAEWREPGDQKSWREESGQPTTDHEGASLRGDFGLPARASIEFEISWKAKPDFVFALGVDNQEATIKRAFRFEAWGGDLVVQRELEQEADLAVVQEVAPGPGRTHLQVYLDQELGRILVFSPGGKQLADLKVAGTRPVARPGLYLSNIRGDLRLEWLRIGRWNGEVPREVRTDQARIHRADGSILYGHLIRYDSAAKEFVLRTETGESRVAESQASSVFLSLPRDEAPRLIRAVYQDGARLSGELVQVEDGAVQLVVPGIKEPLRLPLAGLRSLVVLRHDTPPLKIPSAPRLELDGVQLHGRLVDGQERPGASCLTWLPVGSTTASPLRPGVSGKVVYREPPPSTALSRQGFAGQPERQARAAALAEQLRARQLAMVAGRNRAAIAPPAEPEETTPRGERRSLYLRSGDVILSEITGISEEGVSFRSSVSSSTFVPHEKVKVVELAPTTTLTVRLSPSKRERLLTLPRMQKASPPTHLIRSRNGDYLRGRVVRMDDKTLQVETRLETRELPRARIAQIIWLHPDELDPSRKPAATSQATRVQAVRHDGIRLTFFPEQLAGQILSGKSDVLGACHVRLLDVDQLLIGGGIEQAAALLPYGQWKLQNAPEPIEPVGDSPGAPGGGATGTESPLVGKPAPDFDLDLLGGNRFHLADLKGKVIVLDFWATWCGPCLQAMPQVEKATAAFPENDVQLVAVNLQETPEQIRAMMERHQLHPPHVALDKDGTVAEKYGAVAIPQTVIIDRQGKVARLFVGSSPHLGDQLKEALKAILTGAKPDEAKK
ncbi:MAG TPA: TlpA disulfide reductase family protein [Isosphaeraceae bacterium]|nr:TlpA disulfide reductase family protein [Isosphaeraceae bacterium]